MTTQLEDEAWFSWAARELSIDLLLEALLPLHECVSRKCCYMYQNTHECHCAVAT